MMSSMAKYTVLLISTPAASRALGLPPLAHVTWTPDVSSWHNPIWFSHHATQPDLCGSARWAVWRSALGKEKVSHCSHGFTKNTLAAPKGGWHSSAGRRDAWWLSRVSSFPYGEMFNLAALSTTTLWLTAKGRQAAIQNEGKRRDIAPPWF